MSTVGSLSESFYLCCCLRTALLCSRKGVVRAKRTTTYNLHRTGDAISPIRGVINYGNIPYMHCLDVKYIICRHVKEVHPYFAVNKIYKKYATRMHMLTF